MERTIAINGIRLDEVRMPLKPYANGVLSSMSYPMSNIHLSEDDRGLCLVVPAYLAVELYRSRILPQDVNTPVDISIGDRAAGRYVISDVRYPNSSGGPFGEVTFTLTQVQQPSVCESTDAPQQAPSVKANEGTYVTDITHYLDESGELMPLPGPARKLASFLALLIEAATGAPLGNYEESSIRCRTRRCKGMILTLLPPNGDEISWHCPDCGHNGIIRNWQKTKWNQLKANEHPQ